MRQQDRPQTIVSFGLVFLEPEHFRCCETDGDRVADESNNRIAPAEPFGDGIRLFLGRRIAPQLCRAQYSAIGIERDHAVLLARDADRADVGWVWARTHE